MTQTSARLYRAAALWWLLLFALAFANGVLREFVLSPLLGASVSLPLSGLTAMVLLGFAAWLFVSRYPDMTVPQAWGVGILWVAMTLVGEYVLFVGLMGFPAAEVTASFSREAVLEGNLILFVFAFVALAPRLFLAFRGRRTH